MSMKTRPPDAPSAGGLNIAPYAKHSEIIMAAKVPENPLNLVKKNCIFTSTFTPYFWQKFRPQKRKPRGSQLSFTEFGGGGNDG